MTIAISGSTGLVGSALVEHLQADRVTRIVRGPAKENEVRWDPTAHGFDATPLDGVDAIFQAEKSRQRVLLLMEFLGGRTTVEVDALSLRRAI